MRNNSVKLFWIWAIVVKEIFKRFLIWSSRQPSCSVVQNHLCNSKRRHHGEYSCGYMKFGPVVQGKKVYGQFCKFNENICE